MKNFIIFFFIISFLFIVTANFHGLIDPDEPRYATTAKNMVEKSEYIVPYFNGKLRINKPPLTYWLIALSYKFGKINELFSRMPQIILSLLLILFGYFVIPVEKKFFIPILSSLPLYFYLSRYCNTDVILTAFFSISILFFYKYIKDQKKSYLYLFYLSYLLTSLTKGPVCFLILLIIIIFLFFEKKLSFFKNIYFWLIIFLFSIAPLIHLFIVNILTGNEINLFKLLSQETTGRFLKGYRHPEPFYFYIQYFPLLFFPWSIIFILKFFKLKELWYNNDFNKLSIIWFFTIFIFFSISKSKLISYILPACFPFAIIVSQFIENMKNLNYKIPIFLGVILSVLILFYVLIYGFNLEIKVVGVYIFLIFLLLLFTYFEKNFYTSLTVFNLIIFLSIFTIGYDVISQYKSEKFLQKIKFRSKIISYRRDLTGIAFYYGNYKEISNLKNIPNKCIMVSYKSNFNRIKEKLEYNFLSETKNRVAVFINEIKDK